VISIASRPLRLAFLLLLLGLVAAAPASAARSRLPKGFFGMNLDPRISQPHGASDAALGRQFALMRRSGVQSLRTSFQWGVANPSPGRYVWTRIDRVVTAAARHHVKLLAIVDTTPRWASSNPSSIFYTNYAPRKPSYYADFMARLVRRYGPRGSFFAAHKSVPKVPIREWQVWNEPMQRFYWMSQPWARSYTPMLKAAHAAIHKVDRRAVVVTAALSGTATETPWDDAREIYQQGGRSGFDAVALNQFSSATAKKLSVAQSVDNNLQGAYLMRRTMRRFHDARKPLYLTEFGWSSGLGKIRRSSCGGCETTVKGQSARIAAFYRTLATKRRFTYYGGRRPTHPTIASLGLKRAYYFTWASRFTTATTFNFFGLRTWDGTSGFASRGALTTFQRASHRYRR
jgi:Beta-galactosidase